MEKKIFIPFLLISNLVFAQQHFNDIEKVESNTLNGEHKSYLLLRTMEGDVKISEYDKIISDAQSTVYREKDNSKVSFSIVKNENGIHGFYFDAQNDVAYRISSDNKDYLLYDKVNKEEILNICNEVEPDELPAYDHLPRFVGNSLNASTFNLESKPGAANVLYLDFDGESFLSGWNLSNVAPSGLTNEIIEKIWMACAADYVAFDVNVTTSRKVFDNHPLTKKSWAVFSDFSGANGNYGVAYVNSYGDGRAAKINTGMYFGTGDDSYFYRTPAHELGHVLGLAHDGGPSTSYYLGHGEWTPIMGSGGRVFSQWSKGEYNGATNQEDDLFKIKMLLDERLDDYPLAKQLMVLVNDSVLIKYNEGIIENSADRDTFYFELLTNGEIDLTVSPSIYYSDLDVQLSLLNEQGVVLFNHNPVGKRDCSIQQNLNAGKYYLVIKGGEELTPSTGWSDYATFGYYNIYGAVKGLAKYPYDILLLSMDNESSLCNLLGEFSPLITLVNNGSFPLTSFYADVYFNGSLLKSDLINENLASGETKAINLPAANISANGSVEVVLRSVANEINTKNNSAQLTLNYQVGEEIKFVTDLSTYNGSVLNWSVKNASNVVAQSSSNILIEKVQNSSVQKFCLAPDCYTWQLMGDFELCGEMAYNNSKVYNGGDKAALGGVVYRAKWWTQGTPPPSQVWESAGFCNDGNMSYQLYSGNVLLTNKTIPQNLPSSENFCIDLPTAVNVSNNNGFYVYPNPATDQIHFRNEVVQVKVYDNTGRNIKCENVYANTITLNELSNGIYVIEMITKASERIIEKVLVIK